MLNSEMCCKGHTEDQGKTKHLDIDLSMKFNEGTLDNSLFRNEINAV